MAMPWRRAKAKAAAIRADETGEKLVALNRLFNECFRIQKEASIAAGRHIPLIVENVKGAQPWVGRARWNFGSFYLWGDVPALMPIILGRVVMKDGVVHRSNGATNFHGHKVAGFRFDGSGRSFQSASVKQTGIKAPGMNWSDQTKRGQDFTRLAGEHAFKNSGGSWFNIGSPGQKVTNKNPVHELSGVKVPSEVGRRTDPGKGARFTTRDCGSEAEGIKQRGSGREWFAGEGKISRVTGSKSAARKMASAMIAKIPLSLSRHIGATFYPSTEAHT